MIRKADRDLKTAWRSRFASLPPPARIALRAALLDLRTDALRRAEAQWRRHKAPMALYWKVVGVYAGHLARALPRSAAPAAPSRRRPPLPAAPSHPAPLDAPRIRA